jgi:cell division transport system permease protein
MSGVADIRYDRTWIARLNSTVSIIRGVGVAIIALLAFASAMTVASVVRLTALARRDEIEIMQLVGAPFAYIRGPFIVEGFLQGGMGALVAILVLVAGFGLIRARYGPSLGEAVGLAGMTFVPAQVLVLLVIGGMALGCLGGFVVARTVR